ncbi:TPR repeat-containing protein [gamma proteobacterium HTCC5015]|nr:TPR repeat-containing protein [gamma proteobacterium HTCC5015]
METLLPHFADFHFLRPHWLWLLCLLAVLPVAQRFRHSAIGLWRQWVDPELQAHVLSEAPSDAKSWHQGLGSSLGVAISIALAAIALAGPSWERKPVPLFDQDRALVILLDLSRSMLSEDIRPNRLHRARLKVLDILKARPDGRTALIGYAGDAFLVSPLTRDNRTIALLTPELSPELMPVQGSRLDRAIDKAGEVLRNAKAGDRAQLLLLSDGIPDAQRERAMDRAQALGLPISVIGFGTTEGAPIPDRSGFVKNRNGDIVIAQLERDALQALANLSGGHYRDMSAGEQDIEAVLPSELDSDFEKAQQDGTDTLSQADRWDDQGYWLILPLLLLAALAFRRHLLVLPLALALTLPAPPAEAAENGFDWQQLWLNNDQRAAQHFEAQRYDRAQTLFEDAEWRASAAYRNGDYTSAAQSLEGIDTARAHYNRGNALARSGQLNAAAEAYRAALDIDPEHDDAQYNLSLIEQQQEQQQNSNGDASEPSDNNSESKGENQQDSDSNQNNSDQNNSDQDSSDPDHSEQNSAEQEPPSESQSDQNTDEEKQQQQQKSEEKSESKPSDAEPEVTSEENASTEPEPQQAVPDEEQQATEQWLKQVPDQPGNLLRNKFQLQYRGRQSGDPPDAGEQQPW